MAFCFYAMRILIDDFGIVALFGMPLSAGDWER
jgi:hypothetical protein